MKIPLQFFHKIIIHAQTTTFTIPNPQVKVSILFHPIIQYDLEENQLFIPQSFLGIIYKVYFMTMTF